MEKIRKYLPEHIQVITLGEIVAKSLSDYLQRHPELETLCSRHASPPNFIQQILRNYSIITPQYFTEQRCVRNYYRFECGNVAITSANSFFK